MEDELKPWLSTASESPDLSCFIEGKSLSGLIKWKDGKGQILESGKDDYEIKENNIGATKTISTLMKKDVALSDEQIFTCYVGVVSHTFDVKVIG